MTDAEREKFIEVVKAFDEEEKKLAVQNIPLQYLMYGIEWKLHQFSVEKSDMEANLLKMERNYDKLAGIIKGLPDAAK